MKNRKMLFGIMLFLFVLTGICSIQNVSGAETIEIPPLSYAGYQMGYLESDDAILINEIDSNGEIDVYIMNKWQFEELQDSGDIYYKKKWNDITWMTNWVIDITEDGYYYVILVNEALLTIRTVYVDIDIRYYTLSDNSGNGFSDLLFFVIIPITIAVIVVAISIILVRKHKKKTPREVIVTQEKIGRAHV